MLLTIRRDPRPPRVYIRKGEKFSSGGFCVTVTSGVTSGVTWQEVELVQEKLEQGITMVQCLIPQTPRLKRHVRDMVSTKTLQELRIRSRQVRLELLAIMTSQSSIERRVCPDGSVVVGPIFPGK